MAWLFALLLWVSPAFAAEEPEVDRLALAGLLIRDAHWDRASLVLQEVDVEEKDLDLPRFFTLRGLVQLHFGVYPEAEGDFERAIEAGQTDPYVFLYLAQARDGAGDISGALQALDRGGETIAALPESWMLRALLSWKNEDVGGAWQALEQGMSRYPSRLDFRRQQVAWLIELKLYREAVERGSTLLEHEDFTPNDAVAMAESLRLAGDLEGALSMLEATHLEHPGVTQVKVALAYSLLQADRPLSAGRLLQEAADADPKYAQESAEAYRKAGKYQRALYMNSLVPDAVAKARQRLGLLLETNSFELALALEPRLQRLGLVEEDAVKYALAYAHFRIGNFTDADQALKGIEDSGLFEDAMALREAMTACLEEPWSCR